MSYYCTRCGKIAERGEPALKFVINNTAEGLQLDHDVHLACPDCYKTIIEENEKLSGQLTMEITL